MFGGLDERGLHRRRGHSRTGGPQPVDIGLGVVVVVVLAHPASPPLRMSTTGEFAVTSSVTVRLRARYAFCLHTGNRLWRRRGRRRADSSHCSQRRPARTSARRSRRRASAARFVHQVRAGPKLHVHAPERHRPATAGAGARRRPLRCSPPVVDVVVALSDPTPSRCRADAARSSPGTSVRPADPRRWHRSTRRRSATRNRTGKRPPSPRVAASHTLGLDLAKSGSPRHSSNSIPLTTVVRPDRGDEIGGRLVGVRASRTRASSVTDGVNVRSGHFVSRNGHHDASRSD